MKMVSASILSKTATAWQKINEGDPTTMPHRSAPVSLADVERHSRNALPPKARYRQLDRPCRCHIHSKRHRLADPDGVCGKYVLDAIVSAGVLPDDRSPFITEVSHSQEKVPTSEPESTIISFYYAQI
jgi:hypothetical protein